MLDASLLLFAVWELCLMCQIWRIGAETEHNVHKIQVEKTPGKKQLWELKNGKTIFNF
jgi:hypothetical protein